MKKLVLILVVCLSYSNLTLAETIKPVIKSKIYEWINSHLSYPESARLNKEEGIVYVSFELLENGSVNDVKIEQGVSPSLNSEALSAINKMIISDTFNHKHPKKRYTLPIKFILN